MLNNTPPKIIPCKSDRAWMDATHERFAYRCLPLTMANQYGWQFLINEPFQAKWYGGADKSEIKLRNMDAKNPQAVSHFGAGVITFHLSVVIKTPPGVALYATGPANSGKAGITPLSGIIETEWLPFAFTMNWRFDVPDRWVKFEKDEPFCTIFPVKLDEIEGYELEMKQLSTNQDLYEAYVDARKARSDWIDGIEAKDEAVLSQKWQKDYTRGEMGGKSASNHRTNLRLSKPKIL